MSLRLGASRLSVRLVLSLCLFGVLVSLVVVSWVSFRRCLVWAFRFVGALLFCGVSSLSGCRGRFVFACRMCGALMSFRSSSGVKSILDCSVSRGRGWRSRNCGCQRRCRASESWIGVRQVGFNTGGEHNGVRGDQEGRVGENPPEAQPNPPASKLTPAHTLDEPTPATRKTRLNKPKPSIRGTA